MVEIKLTGLWVGIVVGDLLGLLVYSRMCQEMDVKKGDNMREN